MKSSISAREDGQYYVTNLFWLCDCVESFVHPHTQDDCPRCHAKRRSHPLADTHIVLDQAYTRYVPEFEEYLNNLLACDRSILGQTLHNWAMLDSSSPQRDATVLAVGIMIEHEPRVSIMEALRQDNTASLRGLYNKALRQAGFEYRL